MSGARGVQNDILAKYPSANLRVFTVWLPVLGGDNRSAWRSGTMPDPRVANLWDEKWVSADWFSSHLDGSHSLLWDAYLLYGPQATWDSPAKAPGPLVSRGTTIKRDFGLLQASIVPLIEPSKP